LRQASHVALAAPLTWPDGSQQGGCGT
jgi:hypothetical protein